MSILVAIHVEKEMRDEDRRPEGYDFPENIPPFECLMYISYSYLRSTTWLLLSETIGTICIGHRTKPYTMNTDNITESGHLRVVYVC
jgi:hypothetical protein